MAAAGDCTIRLARSEDLEELCTCWWMLVDEQNLFDRRADATIENQKRARNFLRDRILRGWMFVAISELEKIIAMGTISRDDFFLSGGPDIWNVADIWVHPSQRRNGIATLLMEHIEAQAIRRGASKLRLTVYDDNDAARELYAGIDYSLLMNTLEKDLAKSSDSGEGQGS